MVQRSNRSFLKPYGILIVLALLTLMVDIAPALAQTPPATGSDTCVSSFPASSGGNGLLTQLIDYIKEVVDSATATLFNSIIYNPAFINALNAALALMLIIFAVSFMFGIVPLTLGQALIRLMKVAILYALVNEGFPFFFDYVIRFFNDGTDELIGAVIDIALGSGGGPAYSLGGVPKPFTQLEGVTEKVLSSNMIVAAITSFTTGPMGPAMGGLLGLGIMAYVQAIMKALQIYAVSLVAKALLFGLAPIFLSFLLFERTKQMFNGWLNQLVNYSLQPLLMFTFVSFFFVLMESALDNILKADICWTEFSAVSGQQNNTMMWRFTDKDGRTSTSDFNWDGMVTCIQAGDTDCPDFPISILDMLTFLILAHLAYRFSDVVTQIATEIASSTLFLDKLRSGMTEAVAGAQRDATQIGARRQS